MKQERIGLLTDLTNVTDINECENNPCAADAECVNTDGSFECRCKDGYELDPIRGCGDVNECLRSDTCATNAKCINVPGSYKCICPQGFIGQGRTLCESQSRFLFNHH